MVKLNINKIIDYNLKDDQLSEENYTSKLNKILEESSNKVKTISDKYKFVLNGSIIKKLKSSYHTNISCIWDNSQDGIINFEKEMNDFLVLINIYLISID